MFKKLAMGSAWRREGGPPFKPALSMASLLNITPSLNFNMPGRFLSVRRAATACRGDTVTAAWTWSRTPPGTIQGIAEQTCGSLDDWNHPIVGHPGRADDPYRAQNAAASAIRRGDHAAAVER
jgi:hypothetical protein